MIDIEQIRETAAAIKEYVIRTPTVHSEGVSQLLGVPTTLKLESLQRTGSFKARGAAAKLLSLSDQQRRHGVVAVSGGNHAIAVATMASMMHIPATIVMPQNAPRSSVSRTRAASATVILTANIVAAFAKADSLTTSGLTMIHPFDDPLLISGQGTTGLELISDEGDITDLLVSIGGGGLISGVATAVLAVRPEVQVWGVELAGAQAMKRAVAASTPVPAPVTTKISTLGAPVVSDLTLEHVMRQVAGIKIVSDDEAWKGTAEFAEYGRIIAEPAAGCLMSAARQVVEEQGTRGTRLGILVCGGNMAVGELCRTVDLNSVASTETS